jgi:hypothetical protein
VEEETVPDLKIDSEISNKSSRERQAETPQVIVASPPRTPKEKIVVDLEKVELTASKKDSPISP